MTKDDLIKMARDAGLYTKCEVHSAEPFDQLLERFAALVAAAEREACAKAVEHTSWSNWFQSDCAFAIRERSQS